MTNTVVSRGATMRANAYTCCIVWLFPTIPRNGPSSRNASRVCSRSSDVLNTSAGLNLIIVGTGVGFLFALLALTLGAISFPLLLDRDVGAAVALLTSIRVVAANPLTMTLWGFIVAALLLVGSVPFFLGLTVILPILGHATWHLYRKAVEPDPNPLPEYQPREKTPRSAADFPASLFPTWR